MRRIQKKQAGDLVTLLCRAHAEIRTAIENRNLDAALSLLEQCQEGAMRLGELIEQAEGENFVTIPLLEAYCELVYQIYEDAVRNPSPDEERVYRLLQDSMADVESSVENDIQERIEAVFLPYKASEWEALESVWEAAAEDPACDAYVIPVPYYYKNIDGSFGKMCYDGDKYPDGVPVVKYDEFDFERHQPDMIFIQNPYDEYNHTISVHPFFYSSNLKKFTRELIYIPYFLLDEISPDDERALEGMAHFAAMPGVVNADKVIVQSETMRKTYIEYLTNVAEGTGPIWEKKILGLGSPKMDKAEEHIKEIRDLPQDWTAMLINQDGSCKKAVLYGTSVSVFLQYGEKYLKKMQDVFYAFREKKEEVVLWWRPLPLAFIEEALAEKHPKLIEAYRELVEAFQKEKKGIYDETAEEERAVRLCEAYYGDGSSMVRLFCRQQKPVMIQNVDIMLSLAAERKEKDKWNLN